MILIDKKGKQRQRRLQTFMKDKGQDTYRLMFFLHPADVKDTAFLTYDYDDPGRGDDQWLYLPALCKTKRIATSDKSGSFMGSDLNYSDMTDRELDDYDFFLKKEMAVDGQKVWVIESIPRSEKVMDETGYSKSLLFVRQDIYYIIRGVSWVHNKSYLKYMEVKITPLWRLLIGMKLFYDFAYALKGRDQFTEEVLDAYEDEVELSEAFVQGRLNRYLDIKAGRQIVVWGRSDNIRITDVLNPLDLRE
jgi:hypothetical protein